MTKEETFPIPLKYTDVVRRSNTTVDVLLEGLSEPWKGFTQVTMLDEKDVQTDTRGKGGG